jgi:EpsD family peptidyl-prolyl cis-trans isomerase
MRSLFIACAMLVFFPPAIARAARPEPKTAASGETQVVAKVGQREFTLSELRAEIARLGLSVNAPEAERIALASMLDRHVLAEAARAASLHRKPEAVLRVAAAGEQALADFYLAIAAQPPEPTPEEIADYVAANPSLFAERRVYDFAVMTLPTGRFDDAKMSPLFDDAADFSALAAALEKLGVAYSLGTATQPSTAFPKPIREQLGRYAASDNIVIKGEAQTQIMKITRARRETLPTSEWSALARRMLIEETAARRAEEALARLRRAAPVAYYRASAAPVPAPAAAAAPRTK